MYVLTPVIPSNYELQDWRYLHQKFETQFLNQLLLCRRLPTHEEHQGIRQSTAMLLPAHYHLLARTGPWSCHLGLPHMSGFLRGDRSRPANLPFHKQLCWLWQHHFTGGKPPNGSCLTQLKAMQSRLEGTPSPQHMKRSICVLQRWSLGTQES